MLYHSKKVDYNLEINNSQYILQSHTTIQSISVHLGVNSTHIFIEDLTMRFSLVFRCSLSPVMAIIQMNKTPTKEDGQIETV